MFNQFTKEYLVPLVTLSTLCSILERKINKLPISLKELYYDMNKKIDITAFLQGNIIQI